MRDSSSDSGDCTQTKMWQWLGIAWGLGQVVLLRDGPKSHNISDRLVGSLTLCTYTGNTRGLDCFFSAGEV